MRTEGAACLPAVSLLLLLLATVVVEAVERFLYEAVPDSEIFQAQSIGAQAKIDYVSAVMGVTDEALRNQVYLDGLERCNNVDRDKALLLQSLADRFSDARIARNLENIGLKPFTAQFMTLGPNVIKNVVHMACTKHEKQLQCGAAFEGFSQTKRRIEDLKSIGNHRMMFDKECRETDFAPRVYPCVAAKFSSWSAQCLQKMNAYAINRESTNRQIADLYDGTLTRVKALGPEARPFATSLFQGAMQTITDLEGRKCELFKQMRLCVLRALLHECGPETMRSINASISEGYLRTERRERLNLDFETFGFPISGYCVGL